MCRGTVMLKKSVLNKSGYKSDVDIAYDQFINNIQNNLVGEPNKFWSFVNSKNNQGGTYCFYYEIWWSSLQSA